MENSKNRLKAIAYKMGYAFGTIIRFCFAVIVTCLALKLLSWLFW